MHILGYIFICRLIKKYAKLKKAWAIYIYIHRLMKICHDIMFKMSKTNPRAGGLPR